jgi:hypothetical protein
MDADWSVELGADDPALEFPWTALDGSQRFVDLLQHPDAAREIPEALQFPELGKVLRAVNTPSGFWLTAKCDVWLDDELGEAEAIYEARLKFCSYVDLIARDGGARFSFEHHEAWVKGAARALSSDEEDKTACEFIVRRCWYHPEAHIRPPASAAAVAQDDELAAGFYVTFYLFGYGNIGAHARIRWADGLRRVTTVVADLGP